MSSLSEYRLMLSKNGSKSSYALKSQSEKIIDYTFTRDPAYKKCLILTINGWEYIDVKYQFHVAASILKDQVDYYIQFRPGVHFKLGTYIIIPDDTSNDINLNDEELENPFLQPVGNRTQWWIIVGRTDTNNYIRYSILKCNWNFKWIINNKIYEVFGCVRNANSYTSGEWIADRTISLDNLSGAWLPDLYYAYGENLKSLGLYDTRTLHYDQRLMVTNNALNPKCYKVTKILDLFPKGIIKLSFKADDFDTKRDCPELMICDYYYEDGNPVLIKDTIESSSISIKYMDINSDYQLVESTNTPILKIGKSSYFSSSINNIDYVDWNIDVIGDFTDDERDYYNGLLSITKFDDYSIAIKVSKANSLIGKKFTLNVYGSNGGNSSSIELEVVK